MDKPTIFKEIRAHDVRIRTAARRARMLKEEEEKDMAISFVGCNEYIAGAKKAIRSCFAAMFDDQVVELQMHYGGPSHFLVLIAGTTTMIRVQPVLTPSANGAPLAVIGRLIIEWVESLGFEAHMVDIHCKTGVSLPPPMEHYMSVLIAVPPLTK